MGTCTVIPEQCCLISLLSVTAAPVSHAFVYVECCFLSVLLFPWILWALLVVWWDVYCCWCDEKGTFSLLCCRTWIRANLMWAAGGLNANVDYWLPSCWKIVAGSDLPKGTAGSARSLQAGGVTSLQSATASWLCLCSCPWQRKLTVLLCLKWLKEHSYHFLLAVKLKVLRALTELC